MNGASTMGKRGVDEAAGDLYINPSAGLKGD